MKKHFALLVLSAIFFPALSSKLFAQDSTGSMLDLVKDSTVGTDYINNAFKSTRVINGQSIESSAPVRSIFESCIVSDRSTEV